MAAAVFRYLDWVCLVIVSHFPTLQPTAARRYCSRRLPLLAAGRRCSPLWLGPWPVSGLLVKMFPATTRTRCLLCPLCPLCPLSRCARCVLDARCARCARCARFAQVAAAIVSVVVENEGNRGWTSFTLLVSPCSWPLL